MKAEGYIKELTLDRNQNTQHHDFRVSTIDRNLEGEPRRFNIIETVHIRPNSTTIQVFDLDRPVYYELPDGTRRKVFYHKKKIRPLESNHEEG